MKPKQLMGRRPLVVGLVAALTVAMAAGPAAADDRPEVLGASPSPFGALATVSDLDGSHLGVLGPGVAVAAATNGSRLAIWAGGLDVIDPDRPCRTHTVDGIAYAERMSFHPGR